MAKARKQSAPRFTPSDARFMEMAFAEARKVKGKTLPNPAVGAVIVKAGQVVGKGGTRPAGQAHAEIVALERAGDKAKGSTLYVTLEPCSHHGKTPPCADAVVAAGVKKVVIAIRDANPLVAGDGIRILEKAGIEVKVGLREEDARLFYEGFFFFIRHGRPKVHVKIAQSLDGRINARPGEETAITGPEAQAWAHALRSRVDAILVTGRTVRTDDPDLTPRLVPGAAAPEAVVLTRRGPFPESARLFAPHRPSRTVVVGAGTEGLPPHVDHFHLDGNSSPAETRDVLAALFAQRGYHSVLVEGGRDLWTLFLSAGKADAFYLLTAPKFLPEGERWDAGLSRDWGKSLKFRNFNRFGNDFLAEFGRTETVE
jgi:diaminohydroxyphosphoribosylaminopyrimidine deaminase/5-amino-6-(5-phosphoribosylamino)uracil reductase